jgi:hypothetical protein
MIEVSVWLYLEYTVGGQKQTSLQVCSVWGVSTTNDDDGQNHHWGLRTTVELGISHWMIRTTKEVSII